ncbi:nucleotide pyrophosphatase/phosphodiesterase isoform X1 [Cryptomeria japonica]|uniref:nucleotide pyrophosphatase/phosphodiesterase isoform X1 n=1 Tax=Cryptomeria japonica TaxID=3369 RepID=UPI0027D9E1BF|nr:nucleotide pyrophosphatase/phosphodiesterase isoform X1 [Cryptomeria japonica]XP_059074349.1 nucleotide pyrophosphatase/phosphodiesterase isoform X1 [Cryptomeria japonica]
MEGTCKMGKIMGTILLFFFLCSVAEANNHHNDGYERPRSDHPFSQIALEKATIALDKSARISATPSLLGVQGETYQWVTVTYNHTSPAADDWIAVFSPANFNASTCTPQSGPDDSQIPLLCSSPIKFQYANYSTIKYTNTGKGELKLRLINQRADFAFAVFSGGLSDPKLLAISNTVSFAYPKAPLYPRLAQGKLWNEMAVTWTSGYGIEEAMPIVEWGLQGERSSMVSPAGTLTYVRNMMCGQPASTVGWRDPGFIHTSMLKDLWPNAKYYYKAGHRLVNGSYVWGQKKSFRASPYPGQDSLQRVIIFGDMGKAERDGSNAYSNHQPGTLNTTDRLIEDLENIDIVFHIGDLSYANGYLSEWDQFTAQVEPIASQVPYMVASGNHERDWPNSNSFYKNTDSGGECGVPAKTTFYVPTNSDAKIWYSTDYGMFHFCIADSELDWQKGTEQYEFIEKCLASADRQKQPWLIFISHRVLGYSSNSWLAYHGAFEEPMGRETYQELWQKYKVDIAFFGHVHNYERSCPVYENYCVSEEKTHYSGTFNATIHVVAGGGGSHLSDYTTLQTSWSVFKDQDFGFVKLTAFNHSSLLFEYKKSSDGEVYDSFWITREYKDVLGCDSIGNCPRTTLAQ